MKDLVDTHEVMRFDVEGILMEGAKRFTLPSCLSQSYRASKMIERINALPLSERGPWLKQCSLLSDFITLNSAIRILERE